MVLWSIISEISYIHLVMSYVMFPQVYDDQGALMYVVAVIIVYSLSMFFLVAALLRRKSAHKSLDGQVMHYMKGLDAARDQDKVCLVQVRLGTELRTPSSTRVGIELMTSRSWQYISCHCDPYSNHLAISNVLQKEMHRGIIFEV